eukprot:TRINITY_DN2139_c0_g1_i1.p2 TRINITY_DN2139_c0_g1~~TRINITY_DN2139_c0_g1_i1.p2  ORF type:complete len:138 (-),score=15.28 TRINITY_DN2139_c0_g1_i1:157-537(-)
MCIRDSLFVLLIRVLVDLILEIRNLLLLERGLGLSLLLSLLGLFFPPDTLGMISSIIIRVREVIRIANDNNDETRDNYLHHNNSSNRSNDRLCSFTGSFVLGDRFSMNISSYIYKQNCYQLQCSKR